MTNAVKVVQSGANHSILLYDLDQRELIFSKLEEWIDIPIQVTNAKPIQTNLVEENIFFIPRIDFR